MVRGLAGELTQSHRYNYSQEPLEEFVGMHKGISVQAMRVVNTRGEQLETMLLTRPNTHTCIIYAHGLGSNRLEMLPIAKHFIDYDVCAFDFSGSGRSQGTHTGYGLLEQYDVQAVIAHLDHSHRYEKYILWGRSMGSVAILINQGKNPHPKVQCLVIDSPFSSFEKVAIELASKKSFVPELLLGFLIDPLRQYLVRNNMVNPFEMNIFEEIAKIKSKIAFIYSKNDSVVNYQHSIELIKKCKKMATEFEIVEDHNEIRTKETLIRVSSFIFNCIRENEMYKKRLSIKKTRGISLTSKDEKESERLKSIRTTIGKNVGSSQCILQSKNKERESLRTRVFTIRSVQTEQDCHEKAKIHHNTMGRYSPINVKKMLKINSILEHPSCTLHNKENRCSNINLMRRNRFH